MSILEEIKAAEHAAEESKREAKILAGNLMREADENAAKEAEGMIANAQRTAKKAIAAAEAEAKIKAKAIIAERMLEDRALAEAAHAKLPEAVEYVIEKVVV